MTWRRSSNYKMEEFSQNGGPEREEQKKCAGRLESGGWRLQRWCHWSRGAGEKQLSFFIQILFAVPAGEGGREGGLAGSRGRGCWEMVKDAKQALQPTLVAHIFVLWNLVCCQKLISAPRHDYTGCRPIPENSQSSLLRTAALSLSFKRLAAKHAAVSMATASRT